MAFLPWAPLKAETLRVGGLLGALGPDCVASLSQMASRRRCRGGSPWDFKGGLLRKGLVWPCRLSSEWSLGTGQETGAVPLADVEPVCVLDTSPKSCQAGGIPCWVSDRAGRRGWSEGHGAGSRVEGTF